MNPLMTDLVLLGLLKGGPQHGYEIMKTIRRRLSLFATLGLKSIYYPLRKLEKAGLVTKTRARKGKRPEKFVYRITPKGEKVFENLLSENFLTYQRPIFNVDLSLYFLPLVKPGVAYRCLRSRLRGMKKILGWLEERNRGLETTKGKKPLHLLAIIDHQLGLTRADIEFTRKLMQDFRPSGA